MDLATYEWLKAAHLIGVIIWMGGLFAVYWLLRIHANAPKDVLDKLTLMERSLAMTMDLGAALAIGCGLTMAFVHAGDHPTTTLFGAPGAGWFHAKLTVVVLGILSVHGIVRGRVAKFSRGVIKAVPAWPWSLLLASIVAVVILVIRGPAMFAPSTPSAPETPTAPAASAPR
jgi:putative membrane protein